MPILYAYFDHKTEPFPTFSPYPKIYDLVWQVSNISLSPFFGWTTIPILFHTMTLWIRCHYIWIHQINLCFFTSFCKILLLSNRQIWFPTTWEISNQNGNFLSSWYWSLNNATNRTNLHLFGTTLLVSPIYTLEFLIYPFWAYLNLCIV